MRNVNAMRKCKIETFRKIRTVQEKVCFKIFESFLQDSILPRYS